MSLIDSYSLIRQYMNRYFCPICLSFGIIGCFFNILLFSQKQFRNISCCTYFLAASIPMFITLILGFVPHAYSAYYPHPVDTTSAFCKIRSYTNQSSAMMYRWLMTIACIDRYMVSSANVRLRQFTNPRIAYRVVITVVIIWMILPIHNLIFLVVKDGLCVNSTIAYAIYYSLFTFILGGLLPSLIMIICAVLIHYNLASKRTRRLRSISYKNEGEIFCSHNARDYQVLLMLFVQVIFYIFSTIPWMVYLVYASLTRSIVNKSIDRIAVERFIRYLTEIIVYIYPTLSFYVYTLTSYTFRAELVNVIRSLLTGRGRSWQGPQPVLTQASVSWERDSDYSSKNGPLIKETEINPTNLDLSSMSRLLGTLKER